MADALPPGPSIATTQTLRYMTDPVAFYAWSRKTFGDTFTVRTLDGPLVITGDPEGAREVFTADPSSFEIFAPSNLGMVFPEHSVPMLAGEPHRRERKLLMPPFHGARMRAYARTMQEVALKRANAWRPGETFSMQDAARGITREVILRNVFGLTDPERIAAFEEAFVAVQTSTTPGLLFFKWLRHEFGGIGPYARYLKANARLDALIHEQLEHRRASPDSASDDVLQLMLTARYDDGSGMSNEVLRAELVSLLVAGYAATATALAWAVYWLHHHPETLKKLRQELAGVPVEAGPEAYAALPYLTAVCNETLRIYPPVPDFFRKVRTPIQVRGYTLPVGVGVAVFSAMVHTREDLYPEPSAFRPERFLERKFSHFEFMPFGGGARRCLGAAFAEQQMKVVLATLVQHYELEMVDAGEKPVRQGLGIGPQRGVRTRMVRRLAS
jgi:cytochrome P450